MKKHFRSAAQLLYATAFVAVTAAPVSAQYFGRNKVQYDAFDFEILKTEHFDIYFYDRERRAVEHAARLAERWHVRLERRVEPRAQRTAAARPLRRTAAFPADEHRRRRDRRGDRRRYRSAEPPDRPAVRRPARRHRSRARPRARARVPVRHHVPDEAGRQRRPARRFAAAAVVHRRYGRVPLDRPRRSAHGDVAPRCGAARQAAEARRTSTTPTTSRTAGATRSGPTSADAGAIG